MYTNHITTNTKTVHYLEKNCLSIFYTQSNKFAIFDVLYFYYLFVQYIAFINILCDLVRKTWHKVVFYAYETSITLIDLMINEGNCLLLLPLIPPVFDTRLRYFYAFCFHLSHPISLCHFHNSYYSFVWHYEPTKPHFSLHISIFLFLLNKLPYYLLTT